jgi:ABC-type Fe3+ transport system permease subunit
VDRIAGLAAAARDTALAQLTILAGLRSLSKTVEQEARKMPIRVNILENEVLRPLFKKGMLEARQEGELTILRRLIEKRFGALPG